MSDKNVFLSYRRGTDSNAASRLYSLLAEEFGEAHIFFDIDSIPLGQDFHSHLNEQVGACEAFIAVIGPSWIEDIQRLHNPGDFVRIEVEAALGRQGIPVIPVLVDGASMPVPEDLPEPLKDLPMRNGLPLPHQYFDLVVRERLAPDLRSILGLDQARPAAALPKEAQDAIDQEASAQAAAKSQQTSRPAGNPSAGSTGDGGRKGVSPIAAVLAFVLVAGFSALAYVGLSGINPGTTDSGSGGQGGMASGIACTDPPDALMDAVKKVAQQSTGPGQTALIAFGPQIVCPIMESMRAKTFSKDGRVRLLVAMTMMMRQNKDQRRQISKILSPEDLDLLLKASVSKHRTLRIHAAEYLFDLGDPRVMDKALSLWAELEPGDENGFYNLALVMTGAAPDISGQKSSDISAQIQALKGKGPKTDALLAKAIDNLKPTRQ